MAEIRGITSIDLGELIGAPLAAMVEAEARAAMATAEFIEEVGFKDGEVDPQLRMARFRYTKPDASGQPAEFTVEVPLLALMPIPALQIKEATVGLAARITELRAPAKATPTTPAATPTAIPTKSLLLEQIRARRVKIAAQPVASSGVRGQEVHSSYDLDISIKLGQADVTVGLERLLQVLDQAVAEKPGNSG